MTKAAVISLLHYVRPKSYDINLHLVNEIISNLQLKQSLGTISFLFTSTKAFPSIKKTDRVIPTNE